MVAVYNLFEIANMEAVVKELIDLFFHIPGWNRCNMLYILQEALLKTPIHAFGLRFDGKLSRAQFSKISDKP